LQDAFHPDGIIRFGAFELDIESGELRRNGVKLRLSGQPFQVLAILLEKPGRIITRDELQKRLWADTFVDFDHNLNTAINKIREVLGDSAESPRFVETLPRRGYRFIYPVEGRQSLSVERNGADAADSTVPTKREARSVLGYMSIAVGAAAVAVFIALMFSRYTSRLKPRSGLMSSTLRSKRITDGTGIAQNSVLSPDGKWIAYVWNGPERSHPQIYVQLLDSPATPLQRTNEKSAVLGGPSWSPDGEQIAFLRCGVKDGGIYLMPAMAGMARRVASTDCWQGPGGLGWTPDGKEIVTVDRCSEAGLMSLVRVSVLTSEKHCVMTPDSPGYTDGVASLRLSPDGTIIAFWSPTKGKCCDLYSIPTGGGTATQLTFEQQVAWSETGFGKRFGGYMWTADSRSIVFFSDRSSASWLWRVPADGGTIEPEIVYPEIGNLSKDGRRLVYSEITNLELPAIWRADLAAPGGPVVQTSRVTDGQDDWDARPSPDNTRLAWRSHQSGFYEIWSGPSTGGTSAQLTHLEQFAGCPSWSPDGRSLVFGVWSPGVVASQNYIVDAEGKNLRSITGGPRTNTLPSWSRDGKSIFFVSYLPDGRQVFRHSLESGEEVQLTRHGGFDPFESYDGKTVYYTKYRDPGLWSVPSTGGKESVVLEDQPKYGFWGAWALTEDGIYYLDAEAVPRPTIMFYRFSNRIVSRVFTPDNYISRWSATLSASMGGRSIYYTQFEMQTVIKMIEFPQ
jgi:Tol biopolymer transport system component/DNA-binding winged helix-turn-helix (wHTH) protein